MNLCSNFFDLSIYNRYKILIDNEISWIGLAIQSEGDNPTIHQNGFSIQIQSKKGLDFWIFSNPQSNPMAY